MLPLAARDSRNLFDSDVPRVPVRLEFMEGGHLLALLVQFLDGLGPRLAREEAGFVGLDRVPLGLDFHK